MGALLFHLESVKQKGKRGQKEVSHLSTKLVGLLAESGLMKTILPAILACGFGFLLAGCQTPTPGQDPEAEDEPVRPVIDHRRPGWRTLGPEDFTQVTSAADTWSRQDGVLHRTGLTVSKMRTPKGNEGGQQSNKR